MKPGGRLVYATCSLLARENEDRAAAFAARHPDWRPDGARRLSPLDGGDGFFIAALPRPAAPLSLQPPAHLRCRSQNLWLRSPS